MKHETAQKFLLMAQDGALSARNADVLAAHLRDCADCRAVAREMEELETQLRYRLKVRYPTVSSAEILLPKARLKAAVAPRFPVVRHYTPLAAGIAALVVLVSVLLYASQRFIPQEATGQQTSTVIAAIVSDAATATVAPSPVVTQQLLPTATNTPPPTATSAPTDEPRPTATAVPTQKATTGSVEVTDATEPAVIVPTSTEESPTPLPPTTVPTAIPTVVPPTATAIPPTAIPTDEPLKLDTEGALAQLNAYVAALNGKSAETIINYFSETTHYGTAEGRRTQKRDELSAEFNALRLLNTFIELERCRPNAIQNGQTRFTISCQLKMTNDWRSALGLSPYIADLAVSLDNNLAINSLLDYQYRDSIADDWNDVQGFQQWLAATHPSIQSQYMRGNPTNYLRFVNLNLLPYANEWVAAGRP